MPDEPATNGDGYTHSFERRFDRMDATIAAIIESISLMRERAELEHELAAKRHAFAMEELREMRDLQREHRIDIMALFEVGKEHRKRLEQLEEGKEPR